VPVADCTKLDALVTPYVDDELAVEEREALDRHVRNCAPCRARVGVERAVRDLIRKQSPALTRENATAALRGRCASHFHQELRSTIAPHAVSRTRTWRSLALAASLGLVVGGALLYGVTTKSERVMAAELAADHIKCFALNTLVSTDNNRTAIEQSLAARFGWRVELPPDSERLGLELIGERPCLYGEGRVAHLMYRHNGKPVSLFMLPNTVRSSELIGVLGHEAAVWSSGPRTFVLIAREPPEEVTRMASLARTAFR
jgi:anti-sigma factor RsiW